MNPCVLILNNSESAIITITSEDSYETYLAKIKQAAGVVLKKELSPTATFTYMDEDEDCISMGSELEFQEMKSFAAARKLLIVNILDNNAQALPQLPSAIPENNIFESIKKNEMVEKFEEVVVDIKDKVSTEFVEIKDKLSTELPKVGEMIENNIQTLVTSVSTMFTQEDVQNVQNQIAEILQKILSHLPNQNNNNNNNNNNNDDNVSVKETSGSDVNNNNENNNNNNTGVNNKNDVEEVKEQQMSEEERKCISKVQELGFEQADLLQLVRKYKCDLHAVLDHLVNSQ